MPKASWRHVGWETDTHLKAGAGQHTHAAEHVCIFDLWKAPSESLMADEQGAQDSTPVLCLKAPQDPH